MNAPTRHRVLMWGLALGAGGAYALAVLFLVAVFTASQTPVGIVGGALILLAGVAAPLLAHRRGALPTPPPLTE